MPTPFQLDILTPERSFYSGPVEGLVVGTPDGEICVLAQRMPLVTPVEIGAVKLSIGGQWREAFISEGFMEVKRLRAFIFTQACEWPEDIDRRRAEALLQSSRESLRQQTSIREHKANQIALARAMARLRVTRTHNYNLK